MFIFSFWQLLRQDIIMRAVNLLNHKFPPFIYTWNH